MLSLAADHGAVNHELEALAFLRHSVWLCKLEALAFLRHSICLCELEALAFLRHSVWNCTLIANRERVLNRVSVSWKHWPSSVTPFGIGHLLTIENHTVCVLNPPE